MDEEKWHKISFFLYSYMRSYTDYTHTYTCMIEMCLRCFVGCPKHIFSSTNINFTKNIWVIKKVFCIFFCHILKDQRYIKKKKTGSNVLTMIAKEFRQLIRKAKINMCAIRLYICVLLFWCMYIRTTTISDIYLYWY